MSALCLLDTETLSLLMRKQPGVVAEAENYLRIHERFSLSMITRYEILRGLKAKRAQKQTQRFEQFCAASQVLPVNDRVILRASEIYAALYLNGELIGDADILIGATALEFDMTLITNNESHFQRISGLRIGNWNRA